MRASAERERLCLYQDNGSMIIIACDILKHYTLSLQSLHVMFANITREVGKSLLMGVLADQFIDLLGKHMFLYSADSSSQVPLACSF